MRVAVTFDVSTRLGEQDALRAARAALAYGGLEQGSLELIFVSDATLAGLHGRFLGDGTVTDVMAFDLSDADGHEFEVYVSVDRAREVSMARAVPIERELALYVVHGVLHLCGFDDHDEDDRVHMRAAEATILQGLGYPGDDAPHEYVGE